MYIKNSILSNIIQIISFIIFCCLIVFFIKPSINRVQKIINNKKISIIQSLEKELDINISYDYISPLILNSLVIDNVEVRSNNLQNKIKLSNITININIMNILFSKNNSKDTSFISSVVLSDGNVSLNFVDSWIKNKLKSGDLSNSVLNSKVYFQNIDIIIDFDLLYLDIVNLNGVIKGGLHQYFTKLNANVMYTPKQDLAFNYIKGDVEVKGYLQPNFSDLITNVSLNNIESDIGLLANQKSELQLINNELTIKSKINDTYNYVYTYKIDKYEMFFNIDTKEFKISNLLKGNDSFTNFNNLQSSKLSGNIKGTYNIKNKNFVYSSTGKLNLIDIYKPMPLTINYNVIGNLDYVTFKKLDVFTKKGYVGFYGGLNLKNFFPNGNLYLNDFKISDSLKISSNIKIKVLDNNFLNGDIKFIDVDNVRISNIKSLIYIDENDISLKAIKKDENGNISISANYNKKLKNTTSNVKIDNLDLGILNTFSKNETFLTTIKNKKLSFLGDFNYSNNNFSYNFKELTILDYIRNDSVKLQGSGNNNEIAIDQLNIKYLDFDFQGRVDGVITKLSSNFKIDSLINDNKYKMNVDVSNDSINITGNYGLEMFASLGNTKYINLKVKDFPLNYKNYSLKTNFTMKSVIMNDKSYLFSVPLFDLTFLNKNNNYNPYISFIVDGTNKNINLSNIIYKDNYAPLKGNINLSFGENEYNSLSAFFNGNENETINLQSVFANDLSDITLNTDLKNIVLDRFLIPNVQGKSSITLSLNGNKEKFSGTGKIITKDALFNSNSLNVNVEYKITEELVTITNMSGNYNTSNIKLPLLTYNYISGDILGKLETETPISNINLKSDIALEFSVKPVEFYNELNKSIFETLNGKVSIINIKNDDNLLLENKTFRIFNNKSAMQIYTTDKNLRFLYSHITGLTSLKINKPYFASLSLLGTVKNNNLNLAIKDLDVDLSIIQLFLPENIVLEELDLHGQISILGTLSEPEFNGLVWLDSKLSTLYIPDVIKPVRLNVQILDNRFNILPSEILLTKAGKVNIFGEMLLESWAPESVVINMSISKDNKIPIYYEYRQIISNINIYTPQLIYYWGNSGSYITGDVIVDNGEIYTKIINVTETKDTIVKKDDSNFEIDLSVEIGSNNKLLWPTKNFPIVNATLNSGNVIDINFNSISKEFKVKGEISIIDGEVDYSGKPFALKEGKVVLDLSNNQLDPYIKILGTKTVLDDDERQVEVLLNFEGGFFSDFKPTFSSTDSTKTEDEISELVGLAVVGDDFGILAFDVLDEIFTSYLTAPVEEGIKDLFGVDNVQIKSGFISSALSNITNNSFDTGDKSVYNLSEMLNNSSLTIGNFITDDFFVKGIFSSLYEDDSLNFGVDLGLTLYTPHFQLGFSLTPKLSDSYEFEPEIALSLEWIYNPEKGKSKEN